MLFKQTATTQGRSLVFGGFTGKEKSPDEVIDEILEGIRTMERGGVVEIGLDKRIDLNTFGLLLLDPLFYDTENTRRKDSHIPYKLVII